MKKVFSVEKYVEDCRKENYSDEIIENLLSNWARKFEGLTAFEMEIVMGIEVLDTQHDWFVEVKEDKKELLDLYRKLLRELDVKVENISLANHFIEKIQELEKNINN